MKVLYVAMKYDYGRPEQGPSLEHNTFYEPLRALGHEVIYFDFMTIFRERGRDEMNRQLRAIAATEHPDAMFCVLFGDELDQDVIRSISGTQTTTIAWFSDDHWRFENYSRHWAPCFNWSVTTANSALPKYARLGYRNVIKSQWACNHHQYKRLDLPLRYDVTFVGLPHGERPDLVRYIRNAGIDIRVWGLGWESGRVDQTDLIRIFNQSRINLNFSNASSKPRFQRWLRFEPQIKARNFEIPGTGGFQLSGRADDIDAYYVPDREIVLFGDRRELVERIRHYLSHEDERAHVAEAGYQRTKRDHTYDRRLSEIFTTAGLPARNVP